MSKHEIYIEGLPEGWKPVAYRVPVKGDNYHTHKDEVLLCKSSQCAPFLIVEKIQPRRIVLEETSFHSIPRGEDPSFWYPIGNKWWKQVKETDLSLNNDDDKLSLSVEECKDVTVLARKISDFIKDK